MNTAALPRTDSRRRQRALLDTAAELFIEVGYEAASLNEIVARAGGSKSSIYTYFKDKEGLFAAVIDDMVEDLLMPLEQPLPIDEPVRDVLLRLAAHNLEVLTSRKGMGLCRMVITESTRVPGIGRQFFEHGPGHAMQLLATYLRKLQKRKQIDCEDPALAAEAFWGMLLHRPMLEAYCCTQQPMSAQKRNRYVETTVDAFISRFC